MTGRTFMNAVANGEMDILQLLLEILAETRSAYCVIGGLAVNAYAEPVVSLDLDIIVAADRVDEVGAVAGLRGLKVVKFLPSMNLDRVLNPDHRLPLHIAVERLKVEKFGHSLNLSSSKSDLRIQLQTDVRYQEFISRAVEKEVLGYRLKVASLTDVLQGKFWAYLDKSRRKSKRQKDLADIMRLVEAHPALENQLPPSIRQKLKD